MAELITGYSVELEEAKESVDENYAQYLTFQVAKESFAVGILYVNEIIEVGGVTDVPMMPDYIRGMINLRGSAVPVIDISARMGKGKSVLDKHSCIVLVEISRVDGVGQLVGMLVDAVKEIVAIEQSNIRPAPKMGNGINTDFIKAMGRVDELFFILLDIDHILSTEQVSKIEELTDHHQAQSVFTH
jgi:purine-binding chemotaxis protein CheW